MLVTAAHSPAWRSQGYVCLACRRAQARAHRGQVRWNSNEQHVAQQPATESWFDGLNDISNEFETTPTKRQRIEKEQRDEGKQAKAAKPPQIQQTQKATAPAPSLKKAGKGRIPTVTSIFGSHSLKGFDILKGSLQKKLDVRDSAPEATSADKTKPRKYALDIEAKSEPASADADAEPALKDKKTPPGPSDHEQLEDLIKILQKETTTKAAKQDKSSRKQDPIATKEQTLQSEPVDTEPRPFPAFTVTPRNNSPDGNVKGAVKVNEQSTNADPALLNGETVKTYRKVDTHSRANKDPPEPTPGSDSGTSFKIRTFASDSPIKSYKSLSHLPGKIGDDEHKEAAQSRAQTPASSTWTETRGPPRLVDLHRQHLQAGIPFGVSPAKTANDHVSFESLRGADKVTPETIIPSSINQMPFGLSSNSSKSILDANDISRQSTETRDFEKRPSFADLVDRRSGSPGTDKPANDMVNLIQKKDVEERGVEESNPASANGEERSHSRLASLHAQRLNTPKSEESDTSSPVEIPAAPPPAPAKKRTTERRKRGMSRKHSDLPDPSTLANVDSQSIPEQGVSIAAAMSGARKGRESSTSEAMSSTPEPSEDASEEQETSATSDPADDAPASVEAADSLSPSDLNIEPLDIPQPPVPYLQYGLDRVLFNPGVYQLQDVDSRVYNFDPYLQKIMPVKEFDFNALKEYKTSSQDTALSNLAQEHGKKYIGSTSSMTSSLAHFHYLFSNYRPLNLSMLSKGFIGNSTKNTFTEINRAPSAIFLRWKNGSYAIDADKEYDGANVLMLLGKSMELLLTLPKNDFERYRKADPRQVPEEQKNAPESFQYTTMGDFLMRSQLDASDPRLPGNGTFDLKTRAVVAVRMNSQDWEEMTGYEIFSAQGRWASYEREYYDMMRSTMLKYMLQARMGRMNGIFVAYHNVERVFGFQYVPIHEMDRALHGQNDTCLGDQEFKASLNMLNEVLNRATAKFPEQSLRIHFETRPGQSGQMPTALHVFAEPMAEDDIDTIQNSQKAKIAAWERVAMGKEDQADADEVQVVEEPEQDESDVAILDADSGNTIDAEVSPNIEASEQTEETTNETTNEASSIATSDSPADVPFLEKMAHQDEDLKPLFHATLIIQNKVNGQVPGEDRPTNLRGTDKWEIDYILKEYETTRSQWAQYEDTKARRKFAFAERVDEEDNADPESDGRDKKEDSYIRFLKQMAQRGSQVRTRLDELHGGEKVVRVDENIHGEREKVEGVEDYMAWLYKRE